MCSPSTYFFVHFCHQSLQVGLWAGYSCASYNICHVEVLDTDTHKLSLSSLHTCAYDKTNLLNNYERRNAAWVYFSFVVVKFQYVYLEGNELTSLPDDFFDCLPRLTWLDLRRNKLLRLPSVYTGRHNHLRTLLLEGNKLRSLPLELGTAVL